MNRKKEIDMSFKEYMHIERLGKDEVDGILEGTCFIFPKLDGTNASVWNKNGDLRTGSRKRTLSINGDNAGFCHHVTETDFKGSFIDLFSVKPNWRVYGEWLVPHTLKSYEDSAWNQFYAFDVMEDGELLNYNKYADVLREFGINVIPTLAIIDNPSMEDLEKLLKTNTYLIKEDGGIGEGLVIKNYDFVNKYGKRIWAKLVVDRFGEHGVLNGKITVRMAEVYESGIIARYVTEERLAKLLAKMALTGPVDGKRIPELFGRLWHEIITEDMWSIVKKYNRPIINFRKLYKEMIFLVKELLPELF